jgi:glycosyltransferase involved in cell wall biosynthesis
MEPSSSHIVVIPSYNTGPRLASVVGEVLLYWRPVLLVVDGSTDGSDRPLHELAARDAGLSVVTLPRNSGKGAAVLAGLEVARDRGFSHALVMDADGQHPASGIAEFMECSRRNTAAMVLGKPVFGRDAPLARLYGRKLSIGAVRVETLGAAIADPLYGFRVYPVLPLLEALGQRSGGRRYDFDTEAAVRLFWAGVRPINLPSPVRYFTRAEGGVSHFRYVRDNLTLVLMHTRLILELVFLRWPAALRHRRCWAAPQRDVSRAG